MKAGIVGAGIMGQTLALKLLQKNWQVTIFDRDATQNCSQAAAGMLTPFSELEKNDFTIFQLGIAALQTHWPEILSQIDSRVYFRKLGSLLVAHARDHAELTRFVAQVEQKISVPQAVIPAQAGIQGDSSKDWIPACARMTAKGGETKLEKISNKEIQDLEPQLKHFDAAYYFAEEGQIDNQAFLRELQSYLQNHGVEWICGDVQDITPRNIVLSQPPLPAGRHPRAGGEGTRLGKNSTIAQKKFDWVFDCRGLAAKNSFADLRGVRGELIWVHAPEVQQQRLVRLLNPRYSLYIVPRPDNIYILGASEIESEDSGPISVRTTLELLSCAYYVNPGFAEARILKTVTHVRPTLENHLPRIHHADGWIAVNGLYRHGFLLAPTLAEEILCGMEERSARRYPQLWSDL